MNSKRNLNDISLLDLFLMETDRQCVTLTHQMSLADSGSKDQVDYGELHRALHSIKGAARIIDLIPVVELIQAMEDALRQTPDLSRTNHNLWLTMEAGVEELKQITTMKASQIRPLIKQKENLLKKLINNLQTGGKGGGGDADALESPARRQRPTDEKTDKPAAAIKSDSSSYASKELFEIFKEDAQNHLNLLSDNIIKLERTPNDSFLIEESMRAAHSLKGAARIIELHEIVRLTHAMEDILVKLQSDSSALSPEIVDSLLAGCDILKDLTLIDAGELTKWFQINNPAIADILNQLTATSRPPKTPAAAKDKTAAQAPKKQPPKISPAFHDQTMRVSANSMNRLMGLAGEAIVESGWLLSMIKKTVRMKKKQDEIWSAIDSIHKRLVDKGLPPYLNDSFDYLNSRIHYCQEFVASYIAEFDDHGRNSANISHRLQREVIANRMQPFSDGIKGLPRLIRDLSRRQNKRIHLEIEGAETKVDRDILEKLEAPLTHMVTNAIDHGIETVEIRQQAGKPLDATIKIQARHASGMLYITISDDGGGIDFEALRQKVIAAKLVSEKIARTLKKSELQRFLFLPNFTTKNSLSDTSGRGVGLDVVHNVLRNVRGSIEVSSETGEGCCFELRLPLTLSIIRSIIAEINREQYAFPLVNVDHVVRLPRDEIKEMEGRQYIISHNKRIGIIPAQQIMDLEDRESDEDQLSIIALENANTTYGLIVDKFLGIRDLVVHPLNPRLGKLRSISAAAIAEDGTAILILDAQDLIMAMDHLISGNRLHRIDLQANAGTRRNQKRILVVDDSVTVREVERKLLINHGFQVDVAIDGIDAWNMIKQDDYDLIITDVDMPHMDGIELLSQIRETQKFEELPVIIVSYKDREEDKNRGLDAGADYYLAKSSFTDRSLIEAVEDLIGYPEKTA